MNELQHYFCTYSLIETFLEYTMLIMKGVEATEGKQEAAIQRTDKNTMTKRQGTNRQIMVDNKNTQKAKRLSNRSPTKRGELRKGFLCNCF
jgi:hypothetical protein